MQKNNKTTSIKKEVVKKVTKKPVNKKTKEEIEEMFSFDFGCDCSSCPHHCGDK